MKFKKGDMVWTLQYGSVSTAMLKSNYYLHIPCELQSCKDGRVFPANASQIWETKQQAIDYFGGVE